MQFITDNYLFILIVASFLIFALIGYIIDTQRNKKNNSNNEVPTATADNKVATEQINLKEKENKGNIPIVDEKK
jgi:hypothetical protein